jgi:hypothetical protein
MGEQVNDLISTAVITIEAYGQKRVIELFTKDAFRRPPHRDPNDRDQQEADVGKEILLTLDQMSAPGT